MPPRKVSWVTIGPEPYLATCQRCGKGEPQPEVPLTLDAFVRYLDYVVERHALCQPSLREVTAK